MRLVLVRHGESEWNKLNLFTGWEDIGLTQTGRQEAEDCGRLLLDEGLDFDVCHTSYLKRAIQTLNLALERMDREWLPVHKSWKLNERHYGALQGLNKAETAARFGEDQVRLWRRSYDVPPPPLSESDARNPRFLPPYRNADPASLPVAESLKMTLERVLPYYTQTIVPDMEQGRRVLIVAHGNSLRALVKHLENISDTDIVDVNIPTGVPLVYELDEHLHVRDRRYLGDQEALRQKEQAVAAQGRAH